MFILFSVNDVGIFTADRSYHNQVKLELSIFNSCKSRYDSFTRQDGMDQLNGLFI